MSRIYAAKTKGGITPSKLTIHVFMLLGFLVFGLFISSHANSEQIGSDEHKKSTQNIQKPTTQQPEQTTQFQTQILETIGRIADQQKAAQEQNNASQKSWNSPAILVNLGLLLVGAVYSWFACLQWRAIRGQVNLERPWITVKPIAPIDWPITPIKREVKPPFTLNVKWTARNAGRSPAFLTGLSINFKCVPFPIPNNAPDYDRFADFSKMIIEPNGSHDSEWLLSKPIDQAELEAILRGDKCIAFFGYATYYDSTRAKKPHTTKFYCYWRILNSTMPWEFHFEPVGPEKTVEYT